MNYLCLVFCSLSYCQKREVGECFLTANEVIDEKSANLLLLLRSISPPFESVAAFAAIGVVEQVSLEVAVAVFAPSLEVLPVLAGVKFHHVHVVVIFHTDC